MLVSQRTGHKCDYRFQGENGADLWPGSFQLPRGSRLFLDSRESLYDESVQLALFSVGGISTTAINSMIKSNDVYSTSTWLVANVDFSHILKSFDVSGWLCKMSTSNFQSRIYKCVILFSGDL